MTDYFAQLQVPRRPWIEPEELQQRFLALSASIHPDRVHLGSTEEKAAAQERFSTLNAAYQCLRDHKERLGHLLELERGSKPKALQTLPSEGAEFFFQLGQTCRELDAFLAERARAASPLRKAHLFQAGTEWVARLEPLQATLESRRATLETALKDLNAAWEPSLTSPGDGHPAPKFALPLDVLEQTYRELAYVQRWSGQLRERVIQLSF